MRRYFTSDLHFGSTNILKYANRPFASAEEALNKLGHAINDCLSKTDVLIHVGDFMLSGADKHDTVEDYGLKYKLDDYLSMLKPNVFLLDGNHDGGHNCEAMAKSMIVDLNHNYKHVYVSHYPSTNPNYEGPDCSKWKFGRGIVLCGHVHQKWKYFYDANKHVLNYNVGCDCHNYKPVEDVTITQDLDFLKVHHDFKADWTMTVQDEIKWKKLVNLKLEEARKQRKQECYLKKGLTEAECQRRKEVAMKAKGLDPNFKKQKPKPKECAFSHEDAVQFGIVPPDTVSCM